jgi:hypothetical protein
LLILELQQIGHGTKVGAAEPLNAWLQHLKYPDEEIIVLPKVRDSMARY